MREDCLKYKGESIVGLPATPPPMPLESYIALCQKSAFPQHAERIWLDYVLYGFPGAPEPQPVVMVSLWGGGSSAGFDVVDRIRFIFFLDGSGSYTMDIGL
jgi:hypothetical protein